MEHIRLALEKASEARKGEEPAVRREPSPRFGLNGAAARVGAAAELVLPKCVLEGRKLEEMRVVSYPPTSSQPHCLRHAAHQNYADDEGTGVDEPHGDVADAGLREDHR